MRHSGPLSMQQSSVAERARARTGAKKFAVIGSGPAGVGALTALLDAGLEGRITLFDVDRPVRRPVFEGAPEPAAIEAYYDAVYRDLWRTQKRKFPPPKTHFAASLPTDILDGKLRVFHSDTLGGMSNFWGGTVLPFTDVELARWPMKRADLDPHYKRMAEIGGIAGRADGLNDYFGADYVNRPPMFMPQVFEKMGMAVNGAPLHRGFTTVAGANRCMVETRRDAPGNCVGCGECLTGCFRGSVYSSRNHVKRMIDERRVELVRGRVRSFDPATRAITIDDEGVSRAFDGFDRVYLAAGCSNTTEIVMRSLGLREGGEMADRTAYLFPVFYFGRNAHNAAQEAHLALSNLIVGLVPETSALPFVQVQVHPNSDYVWRYNMPPALWKLARGLVSWSRGRCFWARFCVHGSLSRGFATSFENDALRFTRTRLANRDAAAEYGAIARHALSRNGFYVPPLPLVRQNANSHNGATLPLGGARSPVNARGEVAPNVFVCDSAAFPDLPAVSLTYTIMAFANRIAAQSLERGTTRAEPGADHAARLAERAIPLGEARAQRCRTEG